MCTVLIIDDIEDSSAAQQICNVHPAHHPACHALQQELLFQESITGDSAGLASGGYFRAEPRRGITKDRVLPEPVADCTMASLLLFRMRLALFCTSALSQQCMQLCRVWWVWGSLLSLQVSSYFLPISVARALHIAPRGELHTCWKSVANLFCSFCKPFWYAKLDPVSTELRIIACDFCEPVSDACCKPVVFRSKCDVESCR